MTSSVSMCRENYHPVTSRNHLLNGGKVYMPAFEFQIEEKNVDVQSDPCGDH